MKVAMPLSNIEEADTILSKNPDEIYCGMNFKFEVSSNRREAEYANVRNYEELKKIVEKAHHDGIKVSFTLNAQVYTDSQINAIKKEIKQISSIGVDNIITTNISLIKYIKQNYPKISIIASSVIGVFNSEAVLFLQELGVSRVILPRDVSISEIKKIREKCPNIELEVFIIGWKCINTDCFCFGFHENVNGKPSQNLCNIEFKGEYGKIIKGGFRECIKESENGCGACKIKELKEIGINHVKIVGRRLPLNEKIKYLDFIKNIIDLDKKFKDHETDIKSVYKKYFKIECAKNCYFNI